jgi:hypothetical protein
VNLPQLFALLPEGLAVISCEFRACGPAKYGGKEMSHEDEEVPQLSTTNVIREHENQDGGISI